MGCTTSDQNVIRPVPINSISFDKTIHEERRFQKSAPSGPIENIPDDIQDVSVVVEMAEKEKDKDESSLAEINDVLSKGIEEQIERSKRVLGAETSSRNLKKNENISPPKSSFHQNEDPERDDREISLVQIKLKPKFSVTTDIHKSGKIVNGKTLIYAIGSNKKLSERNIKKLSCMKRLKPKYNSKFDSPKARGDRKKTFVHNPSNLLSAPVFFPGAQDTRGKSAPHDKKKKLQRSMDAEHQISVNKNKLKLKQLNYSVAKDPNSTSYLGISNLEISQDIDDSVMNGSSYLMPNDISYYGSNNEASIRHSSCVSQTVNEEGREMINQYKVINIIGRGSFGKVMKVLNTETNENFALKTLKKSRMKLKVSLSLGSANGYDVLNEINIIKKMSHPHIVMLREVMEDAEAGKVHLIMDFVKQGAVLSSRYWEMQRRAGVKVSNDNKIEIETARKYFRQLTLAMDYLHNVLNVVHRDIKPGNILIDEDDNVKLSDFGVSEMMDSSRMTNNKAGTRYYLPPEIFKGTLTLNEDGLVEAGAIDIWSMGVTLYYFTHGKLPFYSADLFEFKEMILFKEIEYDNALEPTLINLLKKCLEKDATKRFQIQDILIDEWVTLGGTQPLMNRPIEDMDDDEDVLVEDMSSLLKGGKFGDNDVISEKDESFGN